jgi:hypothetical protein
MHDPASMRGSCHVVHCSNEGCLIPLWWRRHLERCICGGVGLGRSGA